MHPGHLKISYDDIDSVILVLSQCLFAVRGDEDLVTGSLEDRALEKAIGFFVVDNQYSRHVGNLPKEIEGGRRHSKLRCFRDQASRYRSTPRRPSMEPP